MKMKKRRFLTFALALAFMFSLLPSVGVKAYDESDEEETVVTAVAPLASVLVTITEPTIGAAASNSITFDTTLIDAIATGTTPNGLVLGWVDENGDAFTGAFEDGESYTFRFMINSVNDHSVSDQTVAYVNSDDNPATFIGMEADGFCDYCVYEIYYSFKGEPEEPDYSECVDITSVNVSITLPAVGTEVSTYQVETDWEEPTVTPTAKVTSNSNCSIDNEYVALVNGLSSQESEDYLQYYKGTIEAGKYYCVEFLILADEGYKFTEDTDFVVAGASDYVFLKEYSNPLEVWIIAKIKTADAYTILDGDGATVTEGSDLVVRASGDLNKCTDLLLDRKSIKDQATLTAGSTIATIKAALLDTLTAGEHTLTFVYTDGEVSTKFTVVKKASQATVTTTEAPKEEAKNAKTNAASPKTGDAAPLMLASILMLMSFAGVVVLRKKENK